MGWSDKTLHPALFQQVADALGPYKLAYKDSFDKASVDLAALTSARDRVERLLNWEWSLGTFTRLVICRWRLSIAKSHWKECRQRHENVDWSYTRVTEGDLAPAYQFFDHLRSSMITTLVHLRYSTVIYDTEGVPLPADADDSDPQVIVRDLTRLLDQMTPIVYPV